MPGIDLIVRGRRVFTGAAPVPASIHIAGGRIESLQPYNSRAEGAEVYDAGDRPVLPGLVDTHVHINEPGRTGWEGFESATRAAAAGGVTTLVDMPLNSIPATTTLAGLRAKEDAARGQLWVDTGFWGGVVPGNRDELDALWRAGALGFKCFLAPSGVEEFPNVSERDLRQAAPVLAKLRAVLLVHAESPARLRAIEGDPADYAHYLASRPPEAELEAIESMLAISREYGLRVHIVHLAAAEALPVLRAARAEGLPVTVETCPHYLTFAAGDTPSGATEFKCAPPIRGRENREALWTALQAGEIDLVATDHSPCPPSMKAGGFASAWGGVASLQLSLAIMWKHAAERGIGAERLVRWMAAAPARLAGLARRKGSIAPGFDADLAIWNPDAAPGELHHRHKLTPYRIEDYPGAVEATFLRGARIFERGDFAAKPTGAILKSSDAY